MSLFREEIELKESEKPDFYDIDRLEKLLKGKKLTEKQKESLHKLIQYWYER